MKKQLLFLTVIFSLLFSNVFSQTVYVTKTGKKYHASTCRYLSKSSIAINLADAKAKGYTTCSVCKPSSSSNTTKEEVIEPQTQTSSKTVYVTKSGTKYHKSTCRFLSKSSIPIDLSSAKAKGYMPCSVCNPSSNESQSYEQMPKTNETQNQNYSPPTKSTQSVQCSATTKAGTQCKRMTPSSNGKCWQHGGN